MARPARGNSRGRASLFPAAEPLLAGDRSRELRDTFRRFVAAQNGHDLHMVRDLLSTSGDFLWITSGTEVWGREAALARFGVLYKGMWQLAPDTSAFRALDLADSTAQIVVPVTYAIGPVETRLREVHFILNLIVCQESGGWKIRSILPVPEARP